MTPPRLCVPVITPIRGTTVDVDSLARLLRFEVAQGADVIFASGTTGEHPGLSAADRATVREVAIATLRGTGVPCWLGVTGATLDETLTLANAAARAGADAVVLAPLAIAGQPDLAALLDRIAHPNIYLYDNPDLSGGRSLAPAEVRPLQDRLAGIKVSAPLGAVTPWLGQLPLWVGYPDVWFALAGDERRPDGVVMGMANALPSQWAEVLRRDTPALRALFAAYTAATTFGGRRYTVAAAKVALVERGVIDHPDVLPGTPALTPAQQVTFGARFRAVLEGTP